LGSDYPFPLGDLEIGKFITESNLDEEVITDIFSNSTLEWLNLDAKLFI
jgi:aminocarboxymuconate-semialdehyde decarboxylase